MDKSRILEAIRAGCVDPFEVTRHWKDSPSAPAQPDYVGAANAQGAANVDTARTQGKINNPNIITPYGTQTVTWGSGQPTFNEQGYNDALAKYNASQGVPTSSDMEGNLSFDKGAAPTKEQYTTTQNPDQPTVTQTLAPAQQQLLDAQNRISGNIAGVAEAGVNRVGQAVATPFDASNIHQLQADPAARQQAQDAAYRQATSRLDPQFAQSGEALRTQLMNQGLAPGEEAYTNAMRDYNFGKNDAYGSAFNNSFNNGLNAQQADFGMQNQANTANIQNQSFLRSVPLNELNALRTGSQVTTPQFQQYQGAPIGQTPLFQGTQAAGQSANNIYNAQQGAANSFNTGLMGIGAAGAGAYGTALGAAGAGSAIPASYLAGLSMFSDRRLKSNIVRIGTHPLGIGVYEYDIFGGRTIGVMADEVLAVKPDAVSHHSSGYLMVDYGSL